MLAWSGVESYALMWSPPSKVVSASPGRHMVSQQPTANKKRPIVLSEDERAQHLSGWRRASAVPPQFASAGYRVAPAHFDIPTGSHLCGPSPGAAGGADAGKR